MKRYVALLRGVNVGGNNRVPMPELVAAMTDSGFKEVKSYINSGNVLFSAERPMDLASKIAKIIRDTLNLDIDVVVFDAEHWQQVIEEAPSDWGKHLEWKHNILALIPPFNMHDVMTEIGSLNPEIESLVPGRGVLYQSVSLKGFGRSSASKMIGKPVYKKMTIRNYNTAIKLGTLLSKDE